MRTKLNRHAVKRTRAAIWRGILPQSTLLALIQPVPVLRRIVGAQY